MAASTSGSNNPKYGDVYKAAVNGKEMDVLRKFYTVGNPTSPINDHGDTVLHVLVLNHHTKAAIELLQLRIHDLSAKNCKGNTALHEVARVGALEIAKLMVQGEQSLVNESNLNGETPLYWAAAYGQTEMFQFLSKRTNMGLRRNDDFTILHAAVIGEFYGLALQIVRGYPNLVVESNQARNTALHLLGQSPFSFKSGTVYSERHIADSSFIPWTLFKLIIYFCIPWDDSKENLTDLKEGQKSKPGMMRQLFRWFIFLRGIDDTKQKHQLALEIVKQLVRRESENLKWNYYITDEENSVSTSDPLREQLNFLYSANTINDTLMLAAKHGIVEIVGVILKECPWAIEYVDENGKNILHLAAEYRQVGVLKLLKSRRFCINKMVADVDKERNTALHLAAKHHQNNFNVSAYEMTREILWFKQVKDVSQVHTYHHLRNSEGKTADEIFNETHQNLLSKSVEWAKKTTNIFMVISTLIATVNFTAAFAVPGGYNQVTGIPIFTTKAKDLPSFYAYSSVALFFSVVTLGSSFSAYLSRFHSDDFYFLLPLKYLIGGTSLFYSTCYTVFAYIQALILETNGQTTILHFSMGFLVTAIAISVVNLVFIDIMFPVFRYMVDLLLHLVSHYKGQWM
ncbi:uncharacterized protein LOC122093609 [Macadamia integrifolia]|uniref:uncharacterized protein LOC122093609 n=1 Tax=Macadamia integrifolia TaxID=60698 RepID=UPI001C532B13|nr:uncharacterized protein LOC122093609 [Macadamia integrifolia]